MMPRRSRGSTTRSQSRDRSVASPAAAPRGELGRIREPEARFGLVRFGIAAYGISPFDDQSGRDLGLFPVMTVRGPIVNLHEGLATIAIGSGDGIQPTAVGAAQALIGGERRTIAALTIDSVAVDASGLDVRVGDDVILFGPGDSGEPTAEEWAVWAGTIGDEIVAARGVRRLPVALPERLGAEAAADRVA